MHNNSNNKNELKNTLENHNKPIIFIAVIVIQFIIIMILMSRIDYLKGKSMYHYKQWQIAEENLEIEKQKSNKIDYEKIEDIIIDNNEKIEDIVEENKINTEKDFGEKFEEMTSYFGNEFKKAMIKIDEKVHDISETQNND